MGFWKAALMKDPMLVANAKTETAMGHTGQMKTMKDLPADKKITSWIKDAMQLNDKGIKLPPRPKSVEVVKEPDYFMAALKKNKKAMDAYGKFPNGAKKEYILWITEAKTETTRDSRLATAVEWISEGKTRNWKYQK
jgi:uncharacterized protein YdeI (YjbR/CyaY-like superfamily)